ncbi:hypothetical protein [Simiduia aestuariiviva]|uniref:Uncharacterized protein n=1 Tax=Simiduia aestuariiviva TaxID=1510459 RepID=A0A839ULV0_9GAMM|nr:hypothetical protein [Simiduia aestuariiviva]MBB3168663.1 hypothetical protein [Simiduia aestuariiviva]
MNKTIQWLVCAGVLVLAAPALADHRRHSDTDISVRLFTPHIGVHYRDQGHTRYGHRHRHGCGHYWNGRVWGRPVPYHRDYGYYGHRSHHWKKHWRKHHRRSHRDHDWHHGDRYEGRHGGHRDGHHDRRRDDDRHDRRDRRRDDRGHRGRHD